MNDTNGNQITRLICLGLALAVLAAYLPLWHSDFVNFDDVNYVAANPHVHEGLSWSGIEWAFTTLYLNFWHPITWLSYLLDFQLYGNNPVGYHITNLLLHGANSILLFLILQRMTKARWCSALVAALFALHPLHVESVAWISERKDVLSTFFWMLSVGAYARYVEASPSSPAPSSRRRFYLLSLVYFALGLMAKSMLVTLPFILLLLDYWPLQRRPFSFVRLLVEKIPFFALAAGAAIITMIAAEHGGTVASMSKVPLSSRLGNAVVSCARYIQKTFWPSDLSAFYPYQMHWAPWKIAVSVALLLFVTGWVIWRVSAQPYLIVGWFWFLGMLLPVLGLIQNGSFAMADRFTYLSNVGLCLMVVWAVKDCCQTSGLRAPAWGAGIAIVACFALTVVQVQYWRNSELLFRHATEVTSGNGIMASDLGRELLGQGRAKEAVPYLRQAMDFAPDLSFTHVDLGHAYLAIGRTAEALDQLDAAVRLNPNDVATQIDFSRALLRNDLAADAVPHLQKALQLHPDDLQASTDLAWILACHPEAALRNGAKALALISHANQITGGRNPIILAAQAAAYAEVGKFPDAISTIQQATNLLAPDTHSSLMASFRAQLALYQSGKPVRTATPLPALMSPSGQ